MLDMPLSEDAFRKLKDQVSSSAMCTAQPRLIKQLLSIKAKALSHSCTREQWSDWSADFTKELKKIEQRRRKIPTLHYPKLPISGHVLEISDLVRSNPVTIVAGETGSGKTTQIPKICLQAGRGLLGVIGHTQPRRIAAKNVAERIATELGSQLGDLVGYQIRFSEKKSPDGYIKVMTDGILLSEIQRDKQLLAYDTLIIDEAHERSLNIDFLLGYLKKLLKKRSNLKVVITSATIDVEKFSAHFKKAPVIEIGGRNYPVDINYLVDKDPKLDVEKLVVECVTNIVHEDGEGDILVFLSGEKEIHDISRLIRTRFRQTIDVVPVYGRLSLNEQKKIFFPNKLRRVVLATNIAETSLTVPRIAFVVDTGRARISRYSYRSKIQRLQVEPISQASADQRAGRAGREKPGICYRLFTSQDFDRRPAYTDPEILRTNLATVILRMLDLGVGEIRRFPFIDMPDRRMINDGYRLLEEIQAIDAGGSLTKIGKAMATLPLDARLARMLIESAKTGALNDLLIITSGLSIQDPRLRSSENGKHLDKAHAKWIHKESDFLSWVNLWHDLENARLDMSKRQFSRYCKRNFLSETRLREWRNLHYQLRRSCRSLKLPEQQKRGNYRSIHTAIVSGLLDQVAVRKENVEFLGTRNRRFFIFPGSVVMNKPPKWIVAASLLDTEKPYLLNVAKIDPNWISSLGAHLLKTTYPEYFYERSTGRVMATKNQTLFGLGMPQGPKVDFGKIMPELARDEFLRSALVDKDYEGEGLFHKNNHDLVREVLALEDRFRTRDIMVDKNVLFNFYDSRVPKDVCNLINFENWRLKAEKENPRVLQMNLDYLMLRSVSERDLAQFPKTLDFDGCQIELRYRFEPGHAEDGVSALIPTALLHQVPISFFDWVVPGMIRDKCIALLKSLPKDLRRKMVPIPDTIDKILEQIPPYQNDLTSALSDQLKKLFGIIVSQNDWQHQKIDDWYRMNFLLVDDSHQIIASSRDLSQIRQEFKNWIRVDPDEDSLRNFARLGIKQWDFPELPERVQFRSSGFLITAWPALRDCMDSVSIEMVDNIRKAELITRQGQRRLAFLKAKNITKYLSQDLLKGHDLLLLAAGFNGRNGLAENLINAAIQEAIFGPEKVVRTREEFEKSFDRGINSVISIAQTMSNCIEELLPTLHKIRKSLTELTLTFEYAKQDIDRQLDFLFSSETMSVLTTTNVIEYRRYISAIEIRLEKLKRNITRDQEYSRQLRNYVDTYDSMMKKKDIISISLYNSLRNFHWQVEEYRVSLFAQQLRTKTPVSSKRLDEAWKIIDGRLCHEIARS